LALLLGAATYRTRGLVHRFDLRLPPHAGPEVVTAHDLPPARFPDEGSLPASIAGGARRARAVICPSRFAAEELTELLGVTRTRVIPYGLSRDYDNPRPATDDTLQGLGVRPPFLVHAAGASARKNLAALAQSWRALSSRYSDLSLLLCGPPDPRRDRAFDGTSRVVMPGRVASPVLASVMRRSAAVVVPSTYEGFGLPALEGMACGAPVVAARAGALPEVCGDAALLVAPSADGLAEGISAVLDDDALAARLRDSGLARAAEFSWERAARDHVAVYREALDS
jgi:alpha-1,3-rhamnosyl/mannosyltransferase